jgi:hypothetical protein
MRTKFFSLTVLILLAVFGARNSLAAGAQAKSQKIKEAFVTIDQPLPGSVVSAADVSFNEFEEVKPSHTHIRWTLQDNTQCSFTLTIVPQDSITALSPNHPMPYGCIAAAKSFDSPEIDWATKKPDLKKPKWKIKVASTSYCSKYDIVVTPNPNSAIAGCPTGPITIDPWIKNK